MQYKLLLKNDHIEITCPRDDTEIFSHIEQFYPYHFNRIHTEFKISRYFLPEVLKEFRGITEDNISTLSDTVRFAYNEEIARRRLTDDLRSNGPKKSLVVNQYLTLQTHQQLARELAEVNDKYAFFYDTRTGKTPLSLTIIHDDILAHPEHKWLIVCPLYLMNKAWVADKNKFFPDMNIVTCYAEDKQARINLINGAGNVFIINTEVFITYAELLKAKHFYGCFVDESSDLKSNKSKVSAEVVEFSRGLKRFYLLSGSPAPNGEYEYYMQLCCIDFYGVQQSYAQFTKHYFYDTSRDHRYNKFVLLNDKKPELDALIARYAIYVDKEDVLNLPGRDFIPVEFKLPDFVRNAYKTMKDDLYVEVQREETEHKITVASIATKLNKLNQVSSGFIIDTAAKKDNKRFHSELQEIYSLSTYRLEILQNLLNDLGNEQIIIWAYYRKELECIRDMLGSKCALVYGGTSIQEKEQAIGDYMSGKVQYLVAHPESCGKGLTLVVGHIAIYYSLNASFESFKQSYDRIYADKMIQPHFCKYYIFLAQNTIEPSIYYDVLLGKKDVSMAVLDHLKSKAL